MVAANHDLVELVLSKLEDQQILARFLDQPRAVFAELTAGRGDEATLEEVGRRLRERLTDASMSEEDLEKVAGGIASLTPAMGRTSGFRYSPITDTY
jgi:hypothetical protein